MSSHTARVTLRYRPGADVLSGLIDLGEVGATRTDTPDADTSVVWAQVTHGSAVGDHLVSFQLVFAAARLGEGTLPLPAALLPAVHALITTTGQALEAVHDPVARLRAKGEAVTELPVAALARHTLPALAPPSAPADRSRAAQLAHSLASAAKVVRHQPASGHTGTDLLARRLDELSGSIAQRHGQAAPGTTAATRAAARDTPTLSPPQRQALEHAMQALDQPEHWAVAERSLVALLTALEPPAPRR